MSDVDKCYGENPGRRMVRARDELLFQIELSRKTLMRRRLLHEDLKKSTTLNMQMIPLYWQKVKRNSRAS